MTLISGSTGPMNEIADCIEQNVDEVRAGYERGRMMRCFNTEGICRPDVHYMVRLDDCLKRIKDQYIDRGKYFVINRGRQYGKTTTLRALADYLKDTHVVISLDFQMLSTASFSDERVFFGEIYRADLQNLFPRKEMDGSGR